MSEHTEYVLGQMGSSGTIRSRRMFGGTGVYVDDVFCAILTGSGRFFLRVDDTNLADYLEEGMEQMPGRGDALMPYFEVPAHVLEDPEVLAAWVAKAGVAAVAAGTRGPKWAARASGSPRRPKR